MDTHSSTANATASDAAATNASTTMSQVQSGFMTALTTADANAAQSVQILQQVHQARLSQLTRKATSLKAQYGANDPRVQAAQSAVTATTATVSRIAMVNQQLTTATPKVSANGWALYGRVFDEQSKPLAKYTVFLVDSQNAYQEVYGFAYTDSTGYFLLSYAGTQAKSASHTATLLFVEIANAKGQPVYLSPTAFQPAPRSATYQNITVPSGNQPIGDPPEAIRKVALPNKKKGQAGTRTKQKKSSS
jgi:hypothetical protein